MLTYHTMIQIGHHVDTLCPRQGRRWGGNTWIWGRRDPRPLTIAHSRPACSSAEVFSHRPGRTPLIHRNTPIKNNYFFLMKSFWNCRCSSTILLKKKYQKLVHNRCARCNLCNHYNTWHFYNDITTLLQYYFNTFTLGVVHILRNHG